MATAALSDAATSDFAWPFPESRVLRLPLFRGLGRGELAHSVSTAADAGFNGILVALTLGGLPIFPTDTPKRHGLTARIPEFRRRDALGEVSDAAQRHGLRLYLTVQPWRPAGDPPARTVLHWFRRRPDWFARGPDGRRRSHSRRKDLSYCPTHPMRQRYLGDLLSEAAQGYPVVGLIFETTDPPLSLEPGRERCFCPHCRRSAREDGGLDLAATVRENPPAEVLEAWEKWHVEVMHRSIAYFSQRCHKSRQRLLLQCRTHATQELRENESGETESDPRGLRSLRFWRGWLEQGGIDGLILDGLPKEGEAFLGGVEHNLASWPDDALLYPVLAASRPDELPVRLQALRDYPVTGSLVEWSGALTAAVARDLAADSFAPPVFVAEENLLRSVGLLFAEVARLAPAESGLSEFLTDLLAFARDPKGTSEFQALEAMVENVRGLESRVLTGQIDFGGQERLVLRRLSQAKRLARLASHYVGI